MPIPRIKATCTQLGLSIEASLDGRRWQSIQLSLYRERSRPGFGKAVSTFIDPARDREEYFAQLAARGVKFRIVED
jgi:hypothetical protein